MPFCSWFALNYKLNYQTTSCLTVHMLNKSHCHLESSNMVSSRETHHATVDVLAMNQLYWMTITFLF